MHMGVWTLGVCCFGVPDELRVLSLCRLLGVFRRLLTNHEPWLAVTSPLLGPMPFPAGSGYIMPWAPETCCAGWSIKFAGNKALSNTLCYIGCNLKACQAKSQ